MRTRFRKVRPGLLDFDAFLLGGPNRHILDGRGLG